MNSGKSPHRLRVGDFIHALLVLAGLILFVSFLSAAACPVKAEAAVVTPLETDLSLVPFQKATYEWTPNGWLQAIHYPNGVVTAFAYDDSGRLMSVSAGHGAAGRVSRFEYAYL